MQKIANGYQLSWPSELTSNLAYIIMFILKQLFEYKRIIIVQCCFRLCSNEENKKVCVRHLRAIANSIELLYKRWSPSRMTKVLHSFLSSFTERRRMKLKMHQDKYICFGIIFNHVKDLTCWFFATLFSMIFLFNVLAHWYQKHRRKNYLIIIIM